MKYNKLVRDRIPEIIKKKGQRVVFHIAKDKEYWEKLKEKLIEEIHEFYEQENGEEYADILEVVEQVGKFKKFDRKKIALIKRKKLKERGGFGKRVILEES